jgi:hypothetical protein
MAEPARKTQPNTVRNVRSTMPGVPETKNISPHQSTDRIFNEGYAKQGIQPTGLGLEDNKPAANQTTAVRNPQVAYRQPSVVRQPASQTVRVKRKKKKPSKVKTNLARTRAFAVNIGIWSWATFSWLFFQLPMAILSLLFLGAAAALDMITIVEEDDGLLVSIGKRFVGAFADIAEATLELIGVNATLLHPANFFGLTYLIIICFGIFMLLTIFIIYKLSLLKPLSGQGAGIKKGGFILALIGYSIPILNLFPWFIPWTFAVLYKPK